MIAISRTGRLLRRLVRRLVPASGPDSRHLAAVRGSRRGVHPACADLQDHHARRCYRRAPVTWSATRSTLGTSASWRTSWSWWRRGSFEGARAYAARLTAGAARVAVEVQAHRLPHRSEALRGPSASLSLHRGAQEDPRQDLRPPGVHGELRRRPEPRPPARGHPMRCPPPRPSTSCAASRRPSSASPRSREVDSVLRVIPDDQAEKIAIIKSFAPLVAPVRIGRSSSVDLDRLTKALADIRRRFDVVAAEAGEKLPADVQPLRQKAAAVLNRLSHVDRESAEAALSYLQAQLYRDFVGKFHSLQRNLAPSAMTIKDVPEELQRKFIGRGRPLPDPDPSEGGHLGAAGRAGSSSRDCARWIPRSRAHPSSPTRRPCSWSAPILQGTAYAFILVAGLTSLMIRRVRETLLALLPADPGPPVDRRAHARVRDPSSTSANIWGLPLIIGTSRRVRPERHAALHGGPRPHGGPLVARSTVMAVALNGITMMVGFGSLMVATHQGIFEPRATAHHRLRLRRVGVARRPAGGPHAADAPAGRAGRRPRP